MVLFCFSSFFLWNPARPLAFFKYCSRVVLSLFILLCTMAALLGNKSAVRGHGLTDTLSADSFPQLLAYTNFLNQISKLWMEMSNIDNKLKTKSISWLSLNTSWFSNIFFLFINSRLKNTALKHKKSLKYTLISKLLWTFIIDLTLAFPKFIIHDFLSFDRIPLSSVWNAFVRWF